MSKPLWIDRLVGWKIYWYEGKIEGNETHIIEFKQKHNRKFKSKMFIFGNLSIIEAND